MKKLMILVASVAMIIACSPKEKQTRLYTLTNSNGVRVEITNFGGRIVSLFVPDQQGQLQDVVLGFDNLKDYENIPSDFGACIGRYANRLNKGQITVNGVPYQLPTNNFGHTLHGGPTGWQYQVYEAEQINNQCLKLTIVSPDGDNGFPGQVTASCTYTLTEDNTLILDYEATTDAPTVINMTNHTYFNLNGDGSTSILNHVLWLNSEQMTPVDSTYMTTGEIVTIPQGDPFDFFTAPKTVGQDIEADNEQLRNGNGYDHNWVLRPSEEKLNLAATLFSPVTGIELEVYTEEPGIQVYSGNFLDGTVTGKYGKVYNQRNAICLETQKYPDAPNKPQWPSAYLNPGEKYQTRTTFRFSVKNKEEQFVNNLMSQMTYEEKLGQLNLLPVNGDIVTGAEVGEYDLGDRIAKGEVGGLFNLKGVDKIREAQRIAVEQSRLGIPLIFGMDVIHGYETVFPIPLALSCSWDTAAIRLSAQTAAKEATADGICWTFSPMVDICRDARWGRIAEGNGEDPYLGSAIAQAMVKGYQGTDLTSPYTMLACVKHFALYGGAEAGRDYNTVDMSPYRMANDYLPPYKAALDAGCGSVMAAFNTINGVPCHCNQWLLTDLLRKQWGFGGFVVTDYTGILELIAHRMGPDLKTVGQRALQAGCDMDMVSEALNMRRQATGDRRRVDEACKRILIAKYRLGLFEDPYRYCDDSRRATDIYTEANKAQARHLTTETFVLLKNSPSATPSTIHNPQSTLPLSPTAKVALIGPLADTRANMAGTWSVAATFDYKTLREAFEQVLPKGNLHYAMGSNVEYSQAQQQRGELFGRSIWSERNAQDMRAEAIAAAKQADVIVLAMGETSEMSGESAARTSLTMPKAQQDLIDTLATLNKPMVLLNFSGRSVVLTHESEVCDAILQVWFGGSETADAITDVVFGKVSPSGKLTTSFPRSVGQEPLGYRQYSTGRPIEDGEFIKYRSGYLDENTLPLYPFGYGLSYTTFDYSNVTLSRATGDRGQATGSLILTVTNTGKYAGAEVVQLYIRAHHSTWARPVRELRGFERVELAPGESKKVCFAITDETLGYYDDEMNFIVEPGTYDIFINDQLVKQVSVH